MHERDILLAALEKYSPEERAAYLAEVCGEDDQLKTRVKALLRSAEVKDSFLEHPALSQQTEVFNGETDHVNAVVPVSDQVRLDFLAASDDPRDLGKLGPYRVLEAIGHGGMGIVLRAHDTKLNRVVAIKVLAPELAANATARKRFLREAQAAAAVSHDHVVTIYAVEENEPSTDLPRARRGSLPYLVMEFIDGQSLQQKIDQDGHLELKEILRIGRQVAAGLAAAHEQGLVHRDVKPANILLQNAVERVQITDFGLARAKDDVGITRTGEVAGTPQYMSPEQAQGNAVDTRSDLFSLGSVLYAMCTGRSPFRADTTVASLRRVCDDTPRPIEVINPDIPEWLVTIIGRLLQKDPDDRFQTAVEVADVLSKHLSHLQNPRLEPFPKISRPATPKPPRHPGGRRRWAVTAAILVAIFGLASITEATGVTHLAATVIRIATGQGTLVIEVDDPTVQVSLDGEELSITGAGIQELRLRPGQYRVRATKDGEPVKQELVTITRDARQVVKVSLDPLTSTAQAERATPDYTSTPAGAISLIHKFDRERAGNNWITDLAFSPSGRHLLCSGIRPEYWDLETGVALVVKAAADEIGSKAVAISPDGTIGVTGHFFDGIIRLWNLETGKKIREFVGHSPRVGSVAFSPDGKHIVSAGYSDNDARLWNVETGEEVWRFQCETTFGVYAVAMPKQGNVVMVSDGSHLCVVNTTTGEYICQTEMAVGQIKCADISPLGKYLAAGTNHSVIHLWDAETGKQSARLVGHTKTVRTVRFLPDGRHLISGSEDKSMRLWNVETGLEVARIDTENHVTQSVAVSSDGRCAGCRRWALRGCGRF